MTSRKRLEGRVITAAMRLYRSNGFTFYVHTRDANRVVDAYERACAALAKSRSPKSARGRKG